MPARFTAVSSYSPSLRSPPSSRAPLPYVPSYWSSPATTSSRTPPARTLHCLPAMAMPTTGTTSLTTPPRPIPSSPRPPGCPSLTPAPPPPSDDEPDSPSDALFVAGARAMISAASTGDDTAFSTASAQIEAAAAGGHPGAQSALAFLTGAGMTRPVSRSRAFLLHKFAADAGDLQSKMALSYSYFRQESAVPRNSDIVVSNKQVGKYVAHCLDATHVVLLCLR